MKLKRFQLKLKAMKYRYDHISRAEKNNLLFNSKDIYKREYLSILQRPNGSYAVINNHNGDILAWNEQSFVKCVLIISRYLHLSKKEYNLKENYHT